MANNHEFSYRWKLQDGYPKDKNGLRVFSTFACGGGSTMGYKLAGYDMIGANDIDPQMARIYQKNHNPKFYYLGPISDLITIEKEKLSPEMFDLDIFDGSPPCSTFSMAGMREDAFGKKKKFREGQAEQTLSDLFFDWIACVERFRPKVAVAENVKGMLAGNARGYTKMVQDCLKSIGYDVQLFLVNGATMGVPQARERVFFICRRRDLGLPPISDMKFSEPPISFGEAKNPVGRPMGDGNIANFVRLAKPGMTNVGKVRVSLGLNDAAYGQIIAWDHIVLNTITSQGGYWRGDDKSKFHDLDFIHCGSFPEDYDFLDASVQYVVGMSVPPIMTAQIAKRIQRQIFGI